MIITEESQKIILKALQYAQQYLQWALLNKKAAPYLREQFTIDLGKFAYIEDMLTEAPEHKQM